MVGSFYLIGTILNGYNQIHETYRIIHFVSSAHRFCIKSGNESYNFVGHSEFKPIDYDILLMRK